MSERRPTEWRCLRCRAGQEWISHNRAKCHRCHAGREWLEKVDLDLEKIEKKLRQEPQKPK